jgi:Putative DNA-binding domain/EC042_2821-lke REase
VAETDRFLERARAALRESKYLDFKEKFDPGEDGEWIELIKDFVALANTGGGVVVIGVKNDGSSAGTNLGPVLALDGAMICDKLVSFVGDNFDDFEVQRITRASDGTHAAAIVIGPAKGAPLVFVRGGTYPHPTRPNQQKTAFARGAVYVRHGAKSEPATRDDLREFVARQLEEVRGDWLGGIKRVVTAPQGTEIVAIQRTSDEQGEPAIRLTTDENAPLYRAVDFDTTHPYRQTELVEEVSRRLRRGVTFNSHDVQSVKRAHDIGEETRPDFVHKPRFGWYQYSDAFVDWLIERHTRDPEFFAKARQRYYDLTH